MFVTNISHLLKYLYKQELHIFKMQEFTNVFTTHIIHLDSLHK